MKRSELHYRVVISHACAHIFVGTNDREVAKVASAKYLQMVRAGYKDVYTVEPRSIEEVET